MKKSSHINTSAFIELIRERLGITIHSHQICELQKTIIDACQKFNFRPENYLNVLKNCPDQAPVLEHLVKGITVGETYFFRDKKQIALLQNTLLPNLIHQKRDENNLSLRIWSAGCASGEEIYTIAMLLCELLPDIEAWTLNILGTDINTTSLQKAILGVYGEWSMRSIPDYFEHRYFVKEHNHFTLSQKIRDLVKFDYLNLNDGIYPSIFNGTNAQDLILCRNVLIYFDSKRVTELMKKFEESLAPEGYLLLGASDPIDIKSTNLTFHYQQGILFSRPAIKQKAEKRFHTIKKEPITLPIFTQPKKSPPTSEKISPKNSASALTEKATILANEGKLAEAIIILKESLKLDPTNKYSYFTYALTLAELNQFNEAKEALKKTLFLDHQFVAGHYQLGLLLLKEKQQEEGLRCLRNALSIAKIKDPNEKLQGSNDISYGRLADILEHEIDIYAINPKGDLAYENSHK